MCTVNEGSMINLPETALRAFSSRRCLGVTPGDGRHRFNDSPYLALIKRSEKKSLAAQMRPIVVLAHSPPRPRQCVVNTKNSAAGDNLNGRHPSPLSANDSHTSAASRHWQLTSLLVDSMRVSYPRIVNSGTGSVEALRRVHIKRGKYEFVGLGSCLVSYPSVVVCLLIVSCGV